MGARKQREAEAEVVALAQRDEEAAVPTEEVARVLLFFQKGEHPSFPLDFLNLKIQWVFQKNVDLTKPIHLPMSPQLNTLSVTLIPIRTPFPPPRFFMTEIPLPHGAAPLDLSSLLFPLLPTHPLLLTGDFCMREENRG
uniref:Uncharacterized protein n=1 Tax=Chromera velia CCMP2878 TaxID=1169474 RepID=A0A0G4IAN4_9ALVE|eukprot:Cvel_12595.t1-p1 / transcript=Cvel_12595.t1 / gene=Cvel_12595 / organism=Chromera_velia_CCMP2878 / gene_product=hypothetical protein / transcript_product=hypothetical protein / location=Cvel_scaffold831:4446-5638(-) / protein_length=138 / sequence_SO=supercontig / SO=protein_coding / is_pseudo=false